MDLAHSMGHDLPWIAATVALDLAVATGCLLIALRWWRNQGWVPPGPARRALSAAKNIFLYCAIGGYVFIPIHMVWPAWRLYDLFLGALAFATWRYARGARDLEVVCRELGRSAQLEQELQESRAAGRRQGNFLIAISHDLRTPLNGLALQTHAAELALQGQDREGLEEALAEIRASVRATAEMLERFLELGQADSSRFENSLSHFELAPVLEQLVRGFQLIAAPKGLALEVRVPSGLQVCTDRVKLERVLRNLLGNAINFTEAGGVTLLAESSGGEVVFHVDDTGVGVAPEHQESIFEDFFQVQNHERDRRKGFGLGLAISRRLARQLGGELRLERTSRSGSRFTFALPRIAAPLHRAGPGRGPGGDGAVPAAAAPAGG